MNTRTPQEQHPLGSTASRSIGTGLMLRSSGRELVSSWFISMSITLLAGVSLVWAIDYSLKLVLAATFFILGLGALKLSQAVYGDVFSPFAVYMGVWLTAIGLFHLGLVEYIPVQFSTWALILGSILTFAFGCFLVTVMRLSRRRSFQQVEPMRLPSARKFRRAILFVFALAACGALFNFIQIVRHWGVTTLLFDPARIRAAMIRGEVVDHWQLLSWLNEVTIILCVFYFFAYRKRTLLYALLLPILSFANLLLSTGRSRPVIALVTAFWIWILLRGRQKFGFPTIKRALLFSIMVLVVFTAIARWRGRTIENRGFYQGGYLRMAYWQGLATPYVYLTAGFPGFQSLIDNTDTPTYGAQMFRPFIKGLNLFDSRIEVPDRMAENFPIPFLFNSYTYLSPFYGDFGAAGVLLFPFLIGSVSTYLYTSMRRQPSFLLVYINANLFFGLAISIINNHLLERATTLYFICVGLIIAGILRIWNTGPSKGG